MRHLLIFSFLLFVAASASVFAQSETNFKRGEVIEKVAAVSNSSQTYALYLPRDYTPERRWAVLLVFDPLARGKLAAELFQTAAERHGYIVIASNVSQNGMDAATMIAVFKALLNETQTRFSTDAKRIYATGFSGGSRVATRLAVACQNCLAGVFGNGAGYPVDLKPSPQNSFVYFGAAGVDDYNFGEMLRLKKGLTAAGVTNRFEIFPGKHQWATEEVCEQALAWMKLQAMKKGALEKDEKFIDEQMAARFAAAESLAKAQRFYEAYQKYSDAAIDFANLRDTSAILRAAEELKKSFDLKNAERAETEEVARQNKIADEVVSLGAKLLAAETKTAGLQAIRRRLKEVRRQSEAAEDSAERRVARRTLSHLHAESYEAAVFRYERERKYDLAIANLELAREVSPTNVWTVYELARMFSLNKDKKQTLQTLEEAAKLGFKNAARLETETAFDFVRQESRFRKLVAALKTNGAGKQI